MESLPQERSPAEIPLFRGLHDAGLRGGPVLLFI